MQGLEEVHCGTPSGDQPDYDSNESPPAAYQAEHESVGVNPRLRAFVFSQYLYIGCIRITTERTSPQSVLRL